MKKKVTVCVPIYNAALSLRETLNSIILLDYPIHKIKLFNNFSTDESGSIINEFACKYDNIEIYGSESLLSAEENFTRCIQAAEGDFTAILHSDDVYDKSFLSEAVKVFEETPNVTAVFSHAREINMKGDVIGERFIPPEFISKGVYFLSYKELLSKVLAYSNFLTCPSAVVKSDVYRDIVKIWNGKQFRSSADLDTWLRIAEVGTVAFNSNTLMSYRIADVSYSFRLAKTRLSKHEIFLVLEPYVKKNLDWLPHESLNDYKFLHHKDEAFRIINAWKNGVPINEIGELNEVEWEIVFNRLFRSKWHMKISVAIIVARLIKFFKGFYA